jgi:ATP-dependent DNA helicase RecG
VTTLTLQSPVEEIDARIAARRAGLRTKGPPASEVLADALGIRTVGDLLRHYPRRYIDRSATVAIREIRLGQQVTVIGRVKRVVKRLTRRRQTMVTVTIADGTGYLDLMFFNQPWTATSYREGVELAASGRAGTYRGRLQLANQEIEILRDEEAETVHTGRITPVHPATEGITSRTIRELVHQALARLGLIADPLPAEIVEAEGLVSEDDAIHAIHFPETAEALARATDRMKFDELFALELGVAFRKRRLERGATGTAHRIDGQLADAFLAALPFEPTGAQRRAMKELAEDMGGPRPMNRLIQGEVGSGKTVVALYGALIAVQSGHQATIMAPTEVLAGQHLRTVRALFEPIGGRELTGLEQASGAAGGPLEGQQSLLGAVAPEEPGEPAPGSITFASLTGSVTGKARERILAAVADGTIDLVVGTHALVQEGVRFRDLSFAVVDEQHRFGVHQRITLKEKGATTRSAPDVLIMTATPIPRSLALTYYGDLDVSVVDELPVGRRPITTTVARSPAERLAAYELVRAQTASGRQAFVVCAAIDEGNRAEVRAAEQEAARLTREVFPELRISLLHGRMRPGEKDSVMQAFRQGEADVLIATTVVEVGVDVPNATVMLVENAERFGLAQLHQLRGRIGRGSEASTCLLLYKEPLNEMSTARLKVIRETTDGFRIAEEDLKLRGEGDVLGVRQSGLPGYRIARSDVHAQLITQARDEALRIMKDNPKLTGARGEALRCLLYLFERDEALPLLGAG